MKPPTLLEVLMVAVVAQIQPVTPVRARVVNAEVLPQAADGASSDVSAQTTGATEQAAINVALAEKAPRPAPVTDDQEIRLTVKSDTHEVIASLVDTQTNEVIREVPPEEMRRAAEVIRAIIGHLIDKVA